jgi:site-specific DNA recombinase
VPVIEVLIATILHSPVPIVEREGVPSPQGKRYWGKHCIRDDAYKAHTFKEIAALVAPEVAAKLDPEKRHGIWWFNRERVSYTQVAEDGPDGRRYRRRAKHTPRPRSEWIAVPVPDSGIPTEWVDAAREAIASNARTSKNGGRFWELSGGILRCGGCGWAMKTTTVKAGNSEKRNHYYRCVKHDNRHGECPNRKCHRGERVESQVWEAVSGILKDPEQLRADLDAMIEMERGSVRGDAGTEARLWANKLAEVEGKRSRYQEMAASDLITFDELREKLAELAEIRNTAERELEAIRDRFYKMLRLEVVVSPDGSLEVSGAFGDGVGVCESEPLPWSPWWRCSWRWARAP